MVCVTRKWASMDSAWEQRKLEAMLREMLAVGAADRSSEPPASVAQNKRVDACHPQRPVHYLRDLRGRLWAALSHGLVELEGQAHFFKTGNPSPIHSINEPSYTATFSCPAMMWAMALTVAAMPPPQ